jgi:hypothetical protein
MPPATLSIVIFAAEELLKEAPAAFAKLAEIFSKKDVTVLDLQQLRADIAAEKYEQFVPDTQIPPS